MEADPPNLPPSDRLNWLLLLGLILAPAILTSITVAFDHSSSGPAPAVGLIAGGIGGIASGVLLGCNFGRTIAAKVIFSVMLVAVCGVASITIATVGCLMAGFTMSLH